jgi:hypothetical protein
MRLAAKLVAPPVVVVTLAAGVWFLGAVVAPSTLSAIVLGGVWFAVCGALAWLVGRARPELRLWLNGTVVACAVAGLAGLWWTTVRETEVNEPIVTGVPASKLPAGELGPVDPLAPQP